MKNNKVRHTHFRLLALAMLLPLAACRTSPPDNTTPTLNTAVSTPGLAMSVAQGSTSYATVTYTDETSESVATPPDLPSTSAGFDSASGLDTLTLQPPSTQSPGIYQLTITVGNDTDGRVDTVYAYNTFLLYVTPSTPAIVNFPMNGQTTVTATVPLFTRRLPGATTQNISLAPPSGTTIPGLTINSLSLLASTAPDSVEVEANITIDSSQYSSSTLLTFTATPPDNGFNPTSYSESVQILPD